MTTKFIVSGTTFTNFEKAANYASALAERLGRSIDVDCEISNDVTRVERKWVAKMHPPGFTRPTIMDLSA